jgi:hypothetical protein
MEQPMKHATVRLVRLAVLRSVGVAGVLAATWTVPPPGVEAQETPEAIPAPHEVLGIPVGRDSVLADWEQIGRYFSRLASTSPAVRLDTVGTSTLGRPLLLVTITDPEHQRRIEEIRSGQALLADPRRLDSAVEDSLVAVQPAVVFINNNIHSTEIASSQFSMLLAHRLAADLSYRELLRDLVVLMTPSANPDGLDTVVAWYRAHKGTAFEAGPLPWLYHPYVGHDNNRDWFMLTQVESRALSRVLYREWFPEVVWDVHQMGGSGARMFVPPFADPVNPNIDPAIVSGTNLVGSAMATALYDAGMTGVVHRSRFDLWWHGGFRTVPARHNMIGILSEAASARLASPVELRPADLREAEAGSMYPELWPGGRWGIPEIIEYELIAADGLLRLVGSRREAFVRRFVTVGRRAVAAGAAGDPFAYVLPAEQRDPGAVAVLSRALLDAGIEIHRAVRPFTTHGTAYGHGSLVIPMAQPFRAHVKDLLEVQRYPDRREYPGGPPVPPYDATGWTIAWQMGIAIDAIPAPFSADLEPLVEPAIEPGTVFGSGSQWVLANRSADESRTVATALKAGARAWVTAEPLTLQDSVLPAGAVVLEHQGGRLAQLVRDHARTFGFDAWGTDGLQPPERRTSDALPRIGVYKPWTASMDEGWTRWVLEQFGIPYRSVTDSVLRAGALAASLDVLLLPSLGTRSIERGVDSTRIPLRFAGGLGEDGIAAVIEFVRGGGTLVALDDAAAFAIDHFQLPFTEGVDIPSEADGERFYAPGSIFEIALQTGHPITSGMGERTHVYFSRSTAFATDGARLVLGRYVDDPLRSGYALHPSRIAGKAALVTADVGAGRVVLFGFPPQHRGQTRATFKLLFNALLLQELY